VHEGNGPGPAAELPETAEAERRSPSARAPSSERFSLRRLRAVDPSLSRRLEALSRFGGRVRSSEYHLTNACNLRCQGCWVDAGGREVLYGPVSVTTPAWGTRTELRLASPTPFRDETRLGFTLAAPARARLDVYDVAGRRVRTVVDEELGEGDHTATWDGRDAAGRRVSGGTYFARLTVGDVTRTRKVVFLGGP